MRKNKKSSLFRLMSYIRPRAFMYIFGLAGMSILEFGFNFIAALTLKGVTDGAINGDINTLKSSVMLMSICFAASCIFVPFIIYAFDSTVKKATGDIKKELFEHMEKLPAEYIENKHSGDMISRLNSDVQVAENAYSNQIVQLLSAVIGGIGSTIFIFYLNWILAVIAIVTGILGIIINSIYIKPLKKTSDKSQSSLARLTERISDLIAGNSIIKIFNLEDTMLEKYKHANCDTLKWTMKRVVLNSYLSGLNNLFGTMSFGVIIVVGSVLAVKDEITFGTLIAITQMVGSLQYMFRSVGNYVTQIQSSLAGADRIFEILDIPAEDNQGSIKENEDMVNGNTAVEFNDVCFSYGDEDIVLNNLNFKVYKNKVIAIVGSSGGGKSTIYKLLLNFYKPTSGEIKIFGRPILDYSNKKIRDMFAYVPQDNYLFSGSIAENIRYGKPGSTMDEIINASKMSGAHEFIVNLPKGYDTDVGERGASLSGGERQRIAIARATLKDAPILLLDEATSSLDSESEEKVQKALETLMKGRTTMVIAHRLSTIQNADKIMVLENGNVTEEGDHESLIAIGNSYARLYNMQFS
jgi:ATP-binding cassette subfamily B protein